MHNPLVSVVMSVYNSCSFLAEALDSIINQTYENIEIILVDDGSTDESLIILEEYAKIDTRIRLISRENKGLAYSLNEAIRNSKGSYIARMDADDISALDRIEKQVEYMIRNNIHICGSYFRTFRGKNIDENITYLPISNEDIRFKMIVGTPFAHPSVIGKKELFEKYSYNQLVAAQDYDLWSRMALCPNVIFGNIPESLLFYREHSGQVTNEKNVIQCQIKKETSIRYFESRYGVISRKNAFKKLIEVKEEGKITDSVFNSVYRHSFDLFSGGKIECISQYLYCKFKAQRITIKDLVFCLLFFFGFSVNSPILNKLIRKFKK
ncbi:hypothetical protein VIBNISO65_1000003 [Vibrio nigripulchritudo SO65]|uniref:glycosyltransferase n=1 Tax=Vibrio nigripulchritudo TaxID=28173 RepID=UPI0003B21C92|nr:glycosyltransferase [Vibrio nigripulchritudo]CCN41690.1 hypothetical protein VIBNIFTn2_180011 [Vibrio nigripulchritudo FTn2]CCN65069.1 hypothetical protein VIBNIPon4_330011 [Vibrio nigripulchritudo POn4]CCN73995.1 hypothetical protein VIBNISO65_1000003 [Vibrio nigripulchritudo SO65]